MLTNDHTVSHGCIDKSTNTTASHSDLYIINDIVICVKSRKLRLRQRCRRKASVSDISRCNGFRKANRPLLTTDNWERDNFTIGLSPSWIPLTLNIPKDCIFADTIWRTSSNDNFLAVKVSTVHGSIEDLEEVVSVMTAMRFIHLKPIKIIHNMNTKFMTLDDRAFFNLIIISSHAC